MALEPITREETYLAAAAGQIVETPEPITRKEMFLDAIAKSGGGGGGTGGDKWELINDFTVQTDLTHVKITTDKNGNGFNLRKIMVFSHILPCLTALKKDNIKGFLSQADAGNLGSPINGPFFFATGPSATEGKQHTSTFYAEKLSGRYVRVNFTTAYDDGASYRNQGYVNGLYAPQLINIDELGWTSNNIDMFFAGSWQACIGAGSRFVILGVRE